MILPMKMNLKGGPKQVLITIKRDDVPNEEVNNQVNVLLVVVRNEFFVVVVINDEEVALELV